MAAACLTLPLFGAGMAAFAEPDVDRVASGKVTRIYHSSERFESVTFYERGAAGDSLVVAHPAKAAPLRIGSHIGRVIALPSLAEHGVVLIRLAPGADPAELQRELDRFNDDPTSGTRHRVVSGRHRRDGNPIYASGTVDRLLVNEVLVRFRPGTERQAIVEHLASRGAEIVSTPADIATDSFLIRFPGRSGQAARQHSNELDARADVVYAQPNFVIVDHRTLPGGELASAPVTCPIACPEDLQPPAGGDPLFGKQWHLSNAGVGGKAFADVNALNAWEITRGKDSIVIAVLDQLVETTHEDLVGKVLPPWNAFDADESDGVDGSMAGVELTEFDVHGTAVAGLAAAMTGNGLGVAGVAPEARILPIRTHRPTTDIATIKRGIRHAAANAQVLSMSWSLGDAGTNDEDIDAALAFATTGSREEEGRRRVLVFSAGNEQNFPIGYPASRADTFPLIVVAATNQSDALQTVGNSAPQCVWGTQSAANSVAAPGTELYTTDRSGAAGYCASPAAGNYARFHGTSGAAPLVAGAVALMLSVDPALSPEMIRDRLQQTAQHPAANANPPVRPYDASGWGLGWGRIDVCAALQGGESCRQGRGRPNPPTDVIVDP